MAEAIILMIVVGIMLVTIYGAGLIITEHFWIAVLLLLLLPPIFFIWAFFRGVLGK